MDVKELTNMIVHPHGSAARRPGTKFAMDAKFIDERRLIPFEFNTEQAYVLELGENYMRFYKDNAIIVKTSSTSITNITKANPGVVTSNSHGLSNGDYIILGSVTGMSQINNIQFKVAGVTTNTFELKQLTMIILTQLILIHTQVVEVSLRFMKYQHHTLLLN